MRRPQTAFRLMAVIVGLLVLLVIAAPAAARRPEKATRGPRIGLRTADAAQLARTAPQARRARVSGTDECTGWTSTRTPPPTIRVLRAKKREGVSRQIVGTVQEVPFRDYVGVVLAAEWPDHYPIESIKAGALAVKQYAWYYTIVYRGHEVKLEDGSMACYDVEDTTNDQVYYPEQWSPSAKHLRAIESSWPLTLRKFRAATGASTFFLTGYRNGASVACGADVDGWHLFQQSVRRCGLDGRKMRDILRKYLEPQLEIVTLGRHDIIGNEKGDASAFVQNDQDELVAHVWTPGAEPPESGSRTAEALAIGGLVGALSSDIDGDGRDDLVWMRRTGPEEGRIKVARSNGVDYADPEDWYAGTTKASLDDAVLLSGDFNGDERRDVAILARAQGGGHASVFVFKRHRRWWLQGAGEVVVRAARPRPRHRGLGGRRQWGRARRPDRPRGPRQRWHPRQDRTGEPNQLRTRGAEDPLQRRHPAPIAGTDRARGRRSGRPRGPLPRHAERRCRTRGPAQGSSGWGARPLSAVEGAERRPDRHPIHPSRRRGRGLRRPDRPAAVPEGWDRDADPRAQESIRLDGAGAQHRPAVDRMGGLAALLTPVPQRGTIGSRSAAVQEPSRSQFVQASSSVPTLRCEPCRTSGSRSSDGSASSRARTSASSIRR